MTSMKLPLLALTLSVIPLVSTFGCTRVEADEPGYLKDVSTKHQSQIAPFREALSAQSQQQLLSLLSENPGKNFMISQWSLNEAFGVLRLGAEGETEKELARFLHVDRSPKETGGDAQIIRASYMDLVEKGILRQANSLFIRSGEQLEPNFIESAKNLYESEVKSTSFPQPGLTEINRFVNDTTRGRIPKLFEDLDSSTVLVIVNAISFKDKWEEPFEKSATKDGDFTLASGQKLTTKMMNQSGMYRYHDGPKFQSVRLPYRSRLGMVIVLPREGVSLNDLLKDNELFQKAKAIGYQNREGSVSIPKWKSEFTWDLLDWLPKNGVTRIFDASLSELRGIRRSGDNLFVSAAVQKTFVMVDEEGTEAAAATGIGVTESAAPIEPPKPFVFVANRPFVYLIEDEGGTALFAGVVANPEQK